jgi:hypothetical protein
MIAARTRPEPVTIDNLLGRLEAVRRNGDGRWMARCPAHGDRTASLSVRQGDDGRILVHCFGGCEFRDIVATLGLEPQQLFPASDRPLVPRPKPDPMGGTWAFLHRLRTLHRPPAPERMRRELFFIGRLILGGPQALREVHGAFDADRLQCFPLRLILLAAQELAAQGTPRQWFSSLALARELDRFGGTGYARGLGLFTWCRLAAAEARWST